MGPRYKEFIKTEDESAESATAVARKLGFSHPPAPAHKKKTSEICASSRGICLLGPQISCWMDHCGFYWIPVKKKDSGDFVLFSLSVIINPH